jgi:hypothetical protein
LAVIIIRLCLPGYKNINIIFNRPLFSTHGMDRRLFTRW